MEAEEAAASIVGAMVSATDGSRARSLGLPADESADSIVAAYADDYCQ